MTMRIVVAYASGSGSTAEVAAAIAEELRGDGALVDVYSVSDITTLQPYGAVVVGSSIRVGHWLPPAVDFVDKFQDALKDKAVALFTTCLTMVDDTRESRNMVLRYMRPILEKFADEKPVGVGLFAGSLDASRTLIMTGDGFPQGDYRNWEAIRAWGREIRPLLLAHGGKESGVLAEGQMTVVGYADREMTDLSRVDLYGMKLAGSDLADVDLHKAELNWADLRQSNLQQADLRQANLIGAVMSEVNLRGCDLRQATLNGANLQKANLRDASLVQADLNWADLSGSDLTGADLRGATLGWATLRDAVLEDTVLEGARYNIHTRWPDSFDPEAAGCVYIGDTVL